MTHATPRPWHIEDRIYIKSGFQHIVKSTNDSRNERADLQLIVHAVNAYEPMREALLDMVRLAESAIQYDENDDCKKSDELRIAKAKELLTLTPAKGD